MTDVIYPKYYHSRAGDSDANWIYARMRVIPADKQQEVADEYERIYRTTVRKDARGAANTYLHNIAKQYRNKAA
ncbi:hypothetical protein [Pseudoalteromonas sp. S16_S37]|uniref:hypothetical protein n=1 Tax=Pseudoalteromonas sp. S16_S37 TaxID=2720228 RepID=UPI001681B304|nr:hypothetical protein [Pseudoalteromonas sp. S16_S37]MBD1583477.1 hypothetical protein [Pseudoalteromonas sp. S16_S37]